MNMNEICAGRVVVVTGAGRGIGREHALAFARAGASVVVNDVGSALDGTGTSRGPAEEVVDEIGKLGGAAVPDAHDVSEPSGAQGLIDTALTAFGSLDVLVNNAGILRDRTIANMTIDEWDAVIKVHLRGMFAPTSVAARYWRDQSKAGSPRSARIINTTSPAIFGAVGTANYGAAKAGVVAFTLTAAAELGRYGVTANAILPAATTRMTASAGLEPAASAADGSEFDPRDPANVSPFVVWLGSQESAHVTGRVFSLRQGRIGVINGAHLGPESAEGKRWSPTEIGPLVDELLLDAMPNADTSGRPPAGDVSAS